MTISNQPTTTNTESFSLREKFMLAALMMQSVMTLIDVSMFNVAVPTIQAEFGLPIDTTSLVVAMRFLARIGLMPIYGAIGDRLGKKRTYMAGLIIFLIGSTIGWFSPSLIWLIIGRFLQGMGGASLPLSMALITDAFPKERRGRALGIWNSAAPAGSMIGPVVGGFVIEIFGWRSIFLIVIVGSVIALFFIDRLVPRSSVNQEPGITFDWAGALGLMLLATSFLMATTTSSVIPFGSPLNYLFWLMSAIGLIILILNLTRNPNPLFNVGDITNPRLILPAVSVGLRMVAHVGVSFLLVIYLTNVFGKSPSEVGTIVLISGLASIIGVPLGGFLADRWISRIAGSFGLAILMVGVLWLGIVQPQGNYLLLFPGMFLAGLGAGLCLVAFTKEAVASLGENKVGLASGLYNMIRFSGASLSPPVLGIVLANAYERFPGGEAAVEPYQLTFKILAITTLIGVVTAASIPSPAPIQQHGDKQQVREV